jgi:hypothetical protein
VTTEIPEGTMCQRCQVHRAAQVHADSITDWVHGHYALWCECCLIRDNIDQAMRMAGQLPEWTSKLATACQDEPPFSARDLVLANEKLRHELERQWLMAHCLACGKHYPNQDAMNYAHPHPEGEHCYWPRPEVLG